jgi:hypothetical protein
LWSTTATAHGAAFQKTTAFGHRNWPYNLVVTTMWTDPLDSDANIQWTRAFRQALKPFLAEAAYVNY